MDLIPEKRKMAGLAIQRKRGEMSKKSASVKRIDVARLAGVSPSAVSLVLNNHPTTRISFATRERIRQVAKALGYYPNAVARALVTGKRNTVGIVLYFEQTPFDGYSSMILNGIWKAMSEWRMLIGAGDDTRGAAGFFLEKAVDGVFILVPPVRQNEEISALADADFPCVLIGSRLPYGRRMAYVDINNREVGRQATRYLLQSGHRRIAHISGPIELMSSAVERLEGYKAALAEAGVPFDPSLVLAGNYLAESGAQAISEALQRGLRFTAVFAANDSMAYGAWRILGERGLKVPKDVSLIGVDGVRSDSDFPLPLTTYRQPLEKIGREAGKLMRADLCEEKKIGGDEILLPCDFVPGATIAAPASKVDS